MTDFRLCFSKTGPLVYISHLDLTHTFVRAMNRARLPLRYSTGFNPHPKLVFALPLPVGMAGENELCDVGLAEDMTAEEFFLRLKKELPESLLLKQVTAPTGQKLKKTVSADYRVTVKQQTGIGNSIEQVFSAPELTVLKRSKSGEKLTDIKPQLFSFHTEETAGDTVIRLTLDASPEGYLNPDYPMRVLAEQKLLSLRDCVCVRTAIHLAEEAN